MKNRLNNRKGESIVEALVSMLIVALGVIALATMIIISNTIIDRSTSQQKKINRLSNSVVQQKEDEPGSSIQIYIDGKKGQKIEVNTFTASEGTLNMYSYRQKE